MMSSEQKQLPSIGKMLQMTFEKWYEDNIPRHAAVLAFYALFAVAPILLLCVEVLGLVYGHDEAELRVQEQITSFINSPETGAWIGTLLGDILPSAANWWVTAGFVIALLFGASNFFGELKIVLNQIWGVPFSQDVSFGVLAFRRLQSVLMVLAGSFLIFGGFVATSWLSTATDWATLYLNLGSGYATWSYLILIFALLTLFFALIYKFVPDIDVAWQDVWIGAAATALLISVTRLLISLYFSYSHTMTMFGAASALVVILLSVYYAAQIFFLGAEFTHIYSLLHGSEWKKQRVVQQRSLPNTLQSAETEIRYSVNGTVRRQPAEPVEISVTNLEPAMTSNVQPESEKPATLADSGPRRWNPLRFFQSKNQANANPPITDYRPIDSPTTDSLTADSLTADSLTTDSLTTDSPIADVQNKTDPAPTRLRQLLSLPIRVFRPIREIIVAVGVIGAISVAALVGVPFWKKRGKDIEPFDQVEER